MNTAFGFYQQGRFCKTHNRKTNAGSKRNVCENPGEIYVHP